jgi:hypothetical protein
MTIPRFLFSTGAILRVGCLAMIFIIDHLRDIQPDPAGGLFEGFDLDIGISSWEYLLIYTVVIIFFVNTVLSLVVAFVPVKSESNFWKFLSLIRFCYIIELLFLPFLIYISATHIQEEFFPAEKSLLGDVLGIVFSDGRSKWKSYEDWDAVNYSVLALCSLAFVILFWKCYRGKRLKVS